MRTSELPTAATPEQVQRNMNDLYRKDYDRFVLKGALWARLYRLNHGTSFERVYKDDHPWLRVHALRGELVQKLENLGYKVKAMGPDSLDGWVLEIRLPR